jgi:class 3 adenylate cyclase
VSARTQWPAIGGGVIIGIAAYSNSAPSRLCDEAKPVQILISPRVLMKVESAVKVEPVGEFALKGIRRPLAAYNVVAAVS